MPWKIICLLLTPLLFLANIAQATQPQGWGKLALSGSILESACAILTPASRDQTVDMGVLPVSSIVQDGAGDSHVFSIELVSCNFVSPTSTSAQGDGYFEVTFEGQPDNKYFAVNGDVKGIALEISDQHHNLAQPGKPLPKGNIVPDTMVLNYNLRIVSNHQELRAGDYNATIPFKIEYY